MVNIKNDYQLAASKTWLKEFKKALEKARRNSRDLAPRLRQAQVEGIQSQIKDLEVEIQDYESLKKTAPENVMINSLEELPEALVRVRIARHLTQDQLAEKLGIRPQQVQKWEASTYQHASYASILKAANTLGIKMKGGAE